MFPAPLPDLDGLDPEAVKALLIAKHNESIEQHKQLRSNSQEIVHLKAVDREVPADDLRAQEREAHQRARIVRTLS
jgi:hypothetical protein